MRTALCELLGIEHPIIQAGMGSFTSPELVAAVSNAGALGTVGAAMLDVNTLRTELAQVRELTEKPFAVNHTVRSLSEEAFELTLEAKPTLISFAIDDPGERVRQAHEAGILVMLQVPTVGRAREAVALGVDIIVAQGSEAGGFGGSVSTLALVPQVVDIAGRTPVVAAGGIADGRGLAAALMLGAAGVNIGTRFLASQEAPIRAGWKQAIVGAQSEDSEKFEEWNDIFPAGDGAYPVVPRMLTSDFVSEWKNRGVEIAPQAERLRIEIGQAIQQRRWGDLMPFTGQTAGLIGDVLPAAEIIRRMIAEAESALGSTWDWDTRE